MPKDEAKEANRKTDDTAKTMTDEEAGKAVGGQRSSLERQRQNPLGRYSR